jgi:hypothetical protein
MGRHKTRKQKLTRRKQRGHKPYGVRAVESKTAVIDPPRFFLEAQLTPAAKTDSDNPTGKSWEITIIGAGPKNPVIEFEGKRYIRSLNNRLYDVEALKASTPDWEGVKVFDDHLTDKEFEDRQGMRSTVKEWIGTLVEPFFEDGDTPKLKAIYKVVEESVSKKLLNAWEQGVLGSIGLSIDTFPVIVGEALIDGDAYPIIAGFEKILSVDQVSNPAAGGGFDRLIAANTQIGASDNMNEEQVKALIADALEGFKGELGEIVRDTMTKALAADMEETEQAEPTPENEVEEDEPVIESEPTPENEVEEDEPVIESEPTPEPEPEPAPIMEQAMNDSIRRTECRFALRDRLATAKLPP